MPTLDWLNRENAFRIAASLPTRVLRPHAAAPSPVGDAAAAQGNLLVRFRLRGASEQALRRQVPLRQALLPPVAADLKDGGEEWFCAIAIEHHPQVARWVRYLDSDPVAEFWLPTSFGRFYPDFVCELKGGRQLVVEYKGAHLAMVPKEIEKVEVGKRGPRAATDAACSRWCSRSAAAWAWRSKWMQR